MTELSVVTALILQRYALSVPDGAPAPQPVLNLSVHPQQGPPLRVRAPGASDPLSL